jgi:hypothetical protein
VQVLTNGNWPIEERVPCELPVVLKQIKSKFERMYQNKFNNRKLSWLNQFGKLELCTLFTPKAYNLTVNMFQTAVLFKFNEKDTWTYEELQKATDIPKRELDQGLLIMCNPKMKLLLKLNAKKPAFDDPQETITVNRQWSSANIMVKLLPQPKQTSSENQAVQ